MSGQFRPVMDGQHITLNALAKPHTERKIDWVCESFGFESALSNSIIRELIPLLTLQPSVSSEELARRLDISQARLNHHIRNFVLAGILAREKKRIILRGSSLQGMVREIRKDAERIFDTIEEVARIIDEEQGFQG